MESLGLHLGLRHGTLNVIKHDEKEAKQCMAECLTAWLEGQDCVMKTGLPSWYTLVKAIRRIDEGIAKKIKAGTYFYTLIDTPIVTQY